MTNSARLIQTLLVFQFLVANPIHLEYSFIPKINCQDINNNGFPDFMATNNSLAPRTLYHIEINNSNIVFLWEYTMSKNLSGYFSDMILGDFDNNNQLELISSAYQDDKPEIFYVFSVDSLGLYDDSPRIIGFHNIKEDVIYPQKLYALSKNEDNTQLFILTQGSPNRKVIMCEYLDGKINFVGSLGKKFLNESLGPLSISTGNFNEDSVEDIFILNNGINPDGYFIFSDGSEKKVNLKNYPHLKLLHEKGVDINFDEIDDLLFINKNGELMSDVWNSQPISLLDSNINNFSLNLNNGLINLNTISKNGKIGQHIIDPLTKSILTSDYISPDFVNEDSSNINSLITLNHMFLVNNDEFYSLLLDNNMKEVSSSNFIPKTYNQKPDFNINPGNKFIHLISEDTLKSFLHFVGKYLPSGMEFNINNIQLEWIPNNSQLGFHEFIYSLEVREKGKIEMAVEDNIKLVSQKENIIEGEYSYLIYVNDPVKFNVEEKKIKIVNKEPYDWIIDINDANVDANLNVAVIKGENDADFQLVHSTTSGELLDSTLLNFHQAIFSWTPNTKSDSVSFVLMVNDGSSSDTLKFITFIHPEINLSKNQKNYEYTIGQTIGIPIELEQFPLSKNYVYNLINAPENMWINKNGIIHWIPLQTQIDDHIFDVEVSDGLAFSNVQLNININAIPVISSRPSKQFSLNQGDSLSFSLESFDMNINPKLNWKLISGPKGMKLNSNGILKWLGDTLDYHSYEIQLSDGIDSVMWSGSIYVNAIPSIISKPNTIITADSLYKYEIEVIDENKFNSKDNNINNQINYELLEGPLEMSIENNILSWQTESKNSGEHNVSIKVSDGISEVEQQFIILVNSKPVITSLDSISVMIGDTLNLNLKANDLNTSDSLIYTLDDLNSEMNFDESSSLLTWIPSKSFIGDHLFNIKVLDTHDTVGTNQKLKILVYDLPKFSGDLLTEAFVGLEFSGFISGIDMHENKMRNDVSIVIESTTIKEYKFSEYGRYFQWTPTELDIGKQEIIIRLTDERGISKLYTHNISVFNNPCNQCNDDLENSPQIQQLEK